MFDFLKKKQQVDPVVEDLPCVYGKTAEFLLPRLKLFREKKGVSACNRHIGGKTTFNYKTGRFDSTCPERPLTEEEWRDTLDQMIYYLEVLLEKIPSANANKEFWIKYQKGKELLFLYFEDLWY